MQRHCAHGRTGRHLRAALSALHRVGQMALERQLRESVREGLRKSDTEDVLCDELSHALDKFCAQA